MASPADPERLEARGALQPNTSFVIGTGLLVVVAVVTLWRQFGGQLTTGVLITLAPVVAGVWLASHLRKARLRWVVINVLVFVVAPVMLFLSVGVACNATSGGPTCWWDHVPWLVRDAIRSAWSTVTGQPLSRDLFPF